jgi:hypothetical protein
MPGVRDVIDQLMSLSKPITTREVAARAGVSRQGAQKQLKALVESGELSVEGKARAARYFKKESRRDELATAGVLAAKHSPDLWGKVNQLSEALAEIVNRPALTIPIPGRAPMHAQARMARAQTVEVASAGSLFRLSARLLLADVDCDELILDFNGVQDLGDEFVEEVFERWTVAHPLTKLRIVNLQEALAAKVPATFR